MTPVELAALITPSTQDVADVIPRRAIDQDGLGRGDFTAETVPSGTQVTRIAQAYALEVASAYPQLPDELHLQAKHVVAAGVAAAVELSFFPEQQDAGTSGQLLATRYSRALAALGRSVGRGGVTAAPRGAFPPPYGEVVAEFAERPRPYGGW